MDFPTEGLRVSQQSGPRDTNNGGKTAQTVLEGNGIKLIESVVVFPSEAGASGAFQTIRQFEPGASGEVVAPAPQFGDESVVRRDARDGRESVSAVLHKGRALVRLTLEGRSDPGELTMFARRAAEKLK